MVQGVVLLHLLAFPLIKRIMDIEQEDEGLIIVLAKGEARNSQESFYQICFLNSGVYSSLLPRP